AFFSRSGEIGIRSRLKICRYLVPWGFKSPLRHLTTTLRINSLQTYLFLCVSCVWPRYTVLESSQPLNMQRFERQSSDAYHLPPTLPQMPSPSERTRMAKMQLRN